LAWVAGFLVAGSVVGIALGTSVGGAASCGYVARRWMMLLAPYMYALPALPTLVGVSLTLVQWLLVGVWGGFAIRDAGSMRALAWTGGV